MDTAIEAAGLVKTYRGGVRALDGVSLLAETGSVFGLLGPNGAGKSTTVKILTTLSRPDAGEARVAGYDVVKQPAKVRLAIGCVAQKSGLDPAATGRENLVLQGRVYGMRGRELKGRAQVLLERFGLAEAADRTVRTYSGGMQRKLDVAVGLMHRPQVLFLDEPTTGLDPEARVDMWSEIARLAGDEGLTILMTTHYLEEADRLARRLAIVDQGRVVAEGRPDDLKGELRGDAIVVELEKAPQDGEVLRALERVDDLREITVEALTLRARAENGARKVPAVLAALESAGVGVAAVTVARPSLDDVYLRHAGKAFCEDDVEVEEMNNAFVDTWFMTARHFRNLVRQPVWIFISLVQPVVWLLLYGALFRKIVEIPGFGSDSYIDFLTPGIVVMTCLFSAGWSGMGLIDDIDRGVVDRFLVSPASRGSLIAGRLLQGAIVGVIQAVIIILLGLAVGATYAGGVAGLAALTLGAVLLGTAIGALSNGIALLSRREETMIAVSNFVLLPMTFLSSIFMAQALMPQWMQDVAQYNPVNWAVQAGRAALAADPDWGIVFSRLGWLAVFTVVCAWLATRAFRVYQRSI